MKFRGVVDIKSLVERLEVRFYPHKATIWKMGQWNVCYMICLHNKADNVADVLINEGENIGYVFREVKRCVDRYEKVA